MGTVNLYDSLERTLGIQIFRLSFDLNTNYYCHFASIVLFFGLRIGSFFFNFGMP
jgi:hypothetical protein